MSRSKPLSVALGLACLIAAVAQSAAPPVVAPVRPGEAFDPGCPERRVASPEELIAALQPAPQGCARVIVVRDLDMSFAAGCNLDGSCRHAIRIPSGITLQGERGALGRRPVIGTRSKCLPDADDSGPTCVNYDLFQIASSHVHVRGLHFRGPANGSRNDAQNTAAIAILTDPADKPYNVVIAECEFDEWTSAVKLAKNGYPPEEASADQRYGREDAGRILVRGNYFHHNAKESKGYGVVVGGDAYATIEGNVFDYNRHAISASGDPRSGYVARFNYVLEGGFKEGSYYNQHFDVHGELSGGSGGWAGEYFEIANNTFRGEQDYLLVQTRPAFMLRGKPTIGAYFNGNVAVHDDLDAAVKLKASLRGALGIEDHADFNFHAAGNRFDTDRHNDLRVGDFDGDRRADVFVATGTAWFYSRGGQAPWEFLHASDKSARELGFADIDNDGITDVLHRDGAGNLGFLKSGRLAPQPLGIAVPVPLGDVRFGDFDGDRLTDLFHSRDGQWYVSYGRGSPARTWTAVQSSGYPIAKLRFGDFDGVAGTDVVALVGGRWSYSSGADAPWRVLNSAESTSLEHAVVADFDGDGRDDIALNRDRAWVYSPRGTARLRALRDANESILLKVPPLDSLLIGRFDGDAQVEVLGFLDVDGLFALSMPSHLNHLLAWRGGRERSFDLHSWQPMR